MQFIPLVAPIKMRLFGVELEPNHETQEVMAVQEPINEQAMAMARRSRFAVVGKAADMTSELELHGFCFRPTEEELLDFYLKNIIFGKRPRFDIIGLLNIYHYDPWVLPGMGKIGEREWYFFVPRDRKHGNGGRPNRTTENGFWKATGSDGRILNSSDPKRIIGLRKTLVFYEGRAPHGRKTDWVMNEYRLPNNCSIPKNIVLCKIYRKATSLKVLEQRAAMEEEMKGVHGSSSSPVSTMDTNTMARRSRKKRKSIVLFGQEIVPERRRSAIKKTRGSAPPLPPAQLPPAVVKTIDNMEGKDPVFVARKILEWSDVDAKQNRLFVPKSEVLWRVLSEEEKRKAEGGGSLQVMVVDPRGGMHSLKLTKWASLNKIVLKGGWRKLAEENSLEALKDCIELWSFRADAKLCFALNVNRQVQ